MDKSLDFSVSLNAAGNAADKLGEVAKAAERADKAIDRIEEPRASSGRRADSRPDRSYDIQSRSGADRLFNSSQDQFSRLGRNDKEQSQSLKDKGEPDALIRSRLAAVAAWYAATKVFESGAAVLQSYNNDLLTNGQRVRAISEALVPGLSSIRRFWEEVQGVTARIAAARREAGLEQGLTQISERRSRELGQSDSELSLQIGRRAGMQSNPLSSWRGSEFDRSSGTGRVRYEEYTSRQSAQDELVRSRRERDAAGMAVQNQERVTSAAQEDRDQSLRQRDEAARRLRRVRDAESGGYHNRADVERATLELQTAQANVMERQQTLEAETGRLRDARLRSSQAEHASEAARINTMRTELSILQAREQRMSQNQINLGSMGAAQRMAGLNSALALRDSGIENAPRELIDRARQFAPQMVARMAERAGQRYAQEAAAAGIDDYVTDYSDGRTLDQVRSQVDRVQAELRVSVDLNSGQLTDQVIRALRDWRESFLSAVRVELEGFRVQMRTQSLLQANGRS